MASKRNASVANYSAKKPRRSKDEALQNGLLSEETATPSKTSRPQRIRRTKNVVEDESPASDSSVEEIQPPEDADESQNESKEKISTASKSLRSQGTRMKEAVDEKIFASSKKLKNSPQKRTENLDNDGSEPRFLGEPIPEAEARQRWPERYQSKKSKIVYKSNSSTTDEDDGAIQARRHYTQAEIDGCNVFNLEDDAHVQAEEGKPCYICKIVEFFEAIDGETYYTAQWYYRLVDTVIQDSITSIEDRRVFFSEIKNDNPLDSLVEKIQIARISPNVDVGTKMASIPKCDYYCDMLYLLPYSTFVVAPENTRTGSESCSTISCQIDESNCACESFTMQSPKTEVAVLDLYAGCGAMSTGLCLGGNMAGLNMVTKWAVDINKYACDCLELNHPETKVRNESVDDYLCLLKEWEKLCASFSLISNSSTNEQYYDFLEDDGDNEANEGDSDDDEEGDEVFEVDCILGICYGDPNESQQSGLYFKIHWKGYGESEDTWEPISGLGNCSKHIKEFVVNGFKHKLLPLPGDVDVVCGGPPCQGISGFNRFRNKMNPLGDPKNKQLLVYMDVVEYLKPRFVLMENVVDLLKFSDGFLGRYALGRLVQMNYQVRMGMLAAGSFGLPQFRMRVFVWGACPSESLPQYPLPMHDVVYRGVIPHEFEINTVAYDEGHKVQLEKKLFLEDAISDLPAVNNDEERDQMPYRSVPKTDFQHFIRLGRKETLFSCSDMEASKRMVYDHRPLKLNDDDYARVCRIPKKKGANFRDLPGVIVRPDNKVEWDTTVEREMLPSGKPLVPDYAMTFVGGSSSKPFGRLWWDETVPTVVTRAQPHNQVILHPQQDRVLTVRENARLQGFPDYYRLSGPIKERYIQVGNAVAIPVARALGYALALACRGSTDDKPVFTLPAKFPNIDSISSSTSEDLNS
ncbi:Chromo domain [Dillenia turbinata]|uniref:Cytosine-specific methyltransferase n=1 Tax=Dillenia turbinata TaxID=194707 RepID=A0AAN8W3N1_9MAGN